VILLYTDLSTMSDHEGHRGKSKGDKGKKKTKKTGRRKGTKNMPKKAYPRALRLQLSLSIF